MIEVLFLDGSKVLHCQIYKILCQFVHTYCKNVNIIVYLWKTCNITRNSVRNTEIYEKVTPGFCIYDNCMQPYVCTTFN